MTQFEDAEVASVLQRKLNDGVKEKYHTLKLEKITEIDELIVSARCCVRVNQFKFRNFYE